MTPEIEAIDKQLAQNSNERMRLERKRQALTAKEAKKKADALCAEMAKRKAKR